MPEAVCACAPDVGDVEDDLGQVVEVVAQGGVLLEPEAAVVDQVERDLVGVKRRHSELQGVHHRTLRRQHPFPQLVLQPLQCRSKIPCDRNCPQYLKELKPATPAVTCTSRDRAPD